MNHVFEMMVASCLGGLSCPRSLILKDEFAPVDSGLVKEMSAGEVTDRLVERIGDGQTDLIVVNFANPDMVGHTGNIEAVKLACVKVDHCIGELLEAIDQVNGAALVTADHGNSDQMWDPTVNGPHTAHTLNPVELVIYGKDCENLSLVQEDRRLADIAPTVLELIGLEKPAEMTGISLIEK